MVAQFADLRTLIQPHTHSSRPSVERVEDLLIIIASGSDAPHLKNLGLVEATRDQWTQCQRYVLGNQRTVTTPIASCFRLRRWVADAAVALSTSLQSHANMSSIAVRNGHCRHCRHRLCPRSSSGPYGYQTYLTQGKDSVIQTCKTKLAQRYYGAYALDAISREPTPKFYSIKVRLPSSTQIILLPRSRGSLGRICDDRCK